MLVFDRPFISAFTSLPGIHYWYGDLDYKYGYGFEYFTTGLVTNTGSQSSYPAICEENYTSETFHLVWQEDEDIKYYKLTGDFSANTVTPSEYYDVSDALGYEANYKPTIADYVDDRFIVGWLVEDPMTYIFSGAVRPNFGTYWGATTYTYTFGGGDDVESINSNNYSPNGGVVIAYGGSGHYGRYVKTSNMNSIYNQTYTGDVKVCNGSSYPDMLLSTLVTTSTPYEFKQYGQSGLPKASNNAGSITREINITSGENRLFIDLGNIQVDGESIGFYSIDSLGSKAVSEKPKLSNYLVSEGFDLTDKTEIYFDFGMETLNANDFSIGNEKGIDVQVVLMDDKTNEIISEVKSCSVKNKIRDNARKTRIKLNSKSGEKRRVKLALVIEGIEESEMNLVTIISDAESLPKEAVEEISIESFNTVTDYHISQNYPNPFNPTTTIKYELPAEGLVTIKVFDVLGKEIATLIEDKQNSGRYEVTFNGEGLASGMYIYRIDVKSTDVNFKDYSSVRKMLLIK